LLDFRKHRLAATRLLPPHRVSSGTKVKHWIPASIRSDTYIFHGEPRHLFDTFCLLRHSEIRFGAGNSNFISRSHLMAGHGTFTENVPVPDVSRPSDLKRMWPPHTCRHRWRHEPHLFRKPRKTRDGHVTDSRKAASPCLSNLEYPSLRSAWSARYPVPQNGDWMIETPSNIVRHLHGHHAKPQASPKDDVLRCAIASTAIIAKPIEESLAKPASQITKLN